MDNSTQALLNYEMLILIIAVIAGVFLLFALFINEYLPFKKSRDYIKMEMRRTTGNERKFWKRELRKLYLRHIPLIGRFF